MSADRFCSASRLRKPAATRFRLSSTESSVSRDNKTYDPSGCSPSAVCATLPCHSCVAVRSASIVAARLDVCPNTRVKVSSIRSACSMREAGQGTACESGSATRCKKSASASAYKLSSCSILSRTCNACAIRTSSSSRAAKIWLAPNATMPTAIAQTATVRMVVLCLSSQCFKRLLRATRAARFCSATVRSPLAN